MLELKDETDYTGLEYVIRNQYFKPDEEMEVAWIPFRGGSEFDIKSEAERIWSVIYDKNSALSEKQASLNDTVGEFKKLAREHLK